MADMGSVPSVTDPNNPDFKPDGNSPEKVTSASSATLNLSDTYDVWWVFIHMDAASATQTIPEVQVNGDTGANYAMYRVEGTTSTGRNNIVVARGQDGGEVYSSFMMTGRWAGDNWSAWGGGNNSALSSGVFEQGRNNNVASPLSSITVQENSGETVNSITIHAFGWDLQ